LRDVWIRTQRAGVASRRATNLATHLPLLSHPSPLLKNPSLGCPRKCVFDFRRNTEFFKKHTEFRGIPRNSAVFFALKFAGIPRNSGEFRMYLHTEFRR
jgi:hypothetical protein